MVRCFENLQEREVKTCSITVSARPALLQPSVLLSRGWVGLEGVNGHGKGDWRLCTAGIIWRRNRRALLRFPLSSHTCHLGVCAHLQSDLQVKERHE